MKLRGISRTISVSVDGKPREFRLTKLDAFSGASLLRLMARLPEGGASVEALFSCLSDADLRSLMTVCLEHAEVLLPAVSDHLRQTEQSQKPEPPIQDVRAFFAADLVLILIPF